MFFVILIGGVLAVRFLAFLLSPDRDIPKPVRIAIATVIGVGVGFLPLKLIDMLEVWTENSGALMAILNGLGVIPLVMGLGSSVVLVSIAASGDSGTWVEVFRDGDTSYGHDTLGLPLVVMIAWAALLAGLAYLLIYGFSMVAAMVLYFIVQLVGFIIACKGD